MTAAYHEVIRSQSKPMQPLPTGEKPTLHALDGICGVFFDVYGTMFISGSGDIGVAQESGKAGVLTQALSAAGHKGTVDAENGLHTLLETIRAHQERGRADGIDYPEVDIVNVWGECLDHLVRKGWIQGDLTHVDLRRLAVEYEVRTNPCWPMPGLQDCLTRLQTSGLMLGIISNAQFYTLEMIRGLTGKTAEELGFDSDLSIYSYRYLRAKPGEFLYRLAAEALAKRGVAAQNILYVGNDMLNDVQAAGRVGFRTALFAGDLRSLRWRKGDPRVGGIVPDLVITDLLSLSDSVSPLPTDSDQRP